VQTVRKANIKRGDNVSINGGSGGLGSTLVQVAKAAVG
jgi:NADPH:quinone reductase-like Zn-dependent oxidoreductase